MKMKKHQLLAAVCIVSMVTVATVLAGCNQTNQIEVTGTDSGTVSGGQQGGGPGFGGGSSFKQPDLMGTISSVKDGKVTLKLMKVPTFSGASGSRRFTGSGWSRPTGSGFSGKRPTGSGFSGQRPTGSGMSGQRRNFGGEYTGKTKTITLKSDTKIESFSFRRADAASSASQTLSLSSLKKGQTLYVYYKSDKKTIDYVRVMEMQNRGNWQQGSAPGGN